MSKFFGRKPPRTPFSKFKAYQTATPRFFRNDTPVLIELTKFLWERRFCREFVVKYDTAGSQFRLDFAKIGYKNLINIEFDGNSHIDGTHPAVDGRRDKILSSLGWHVIRVTGPRLTKNQEVKTDPNDSGYDIRFSTTKSQENQTLNVLCLQLTAVLRESFTLRYLRELSATSEVVQV